MIRNREMEEAYAKVASTITEQVEPDKETVKLKDEDYRSIIEAYTNIQEGGDYKKNTTQFIDDLLASDDLKGFDKFLKGLKDFLDENGFLTDKQQKALGSIKGNLATDGGKKKA